MLKLVDADKKYLKQYEEAYKLSLKKLQEGKISKHNMMFVDINEVDIIQQSMDNRDQNKLPSHYVPSFDYFVVDEDKFIGIVHIRIRLTPNLLQYGGNIGYAINPKYWNMGYGTKALKLALEKSRELVKDNKVLITCDDDNIGSYKIIEANGGRLENKVEIIDQGEKFLIRRYWIDIK